MKKILLFLTLALCFCSTIDAKKTWKRGEAEWAKIQLNDHLSYDQAFAMVLELVTDKYEMEMISKDGGYIRSAWNACKDKKGRKIKDQRFRVTIKFNHDRTQIQVKTECQHLKKGEWEDGEDSVLSRQLKDDVRGVLGY